MKQFWLIAALTPSLLFGQFDFRKTNWGTSKEEVIMAEGKPLEQDTDRLLYADTVANHPASVLMEFVDGQLATGAYLLKERFTEPNQYLQAAEAWKQGLEEKYGPAKTETRWLNNLYRNQPDRQGLAVAAGQLTIMHRWQTDTTIITEIISGGRFQVSVAISYTSKQLQAGLEKKRAEARKKVF